MVDKDNDKEVVEEDTDADCPYFPHSRKASVSRTQGSTSRASQSKSKIRRTALLIPVRHLMCAPKQTGNYTANELQKASYYMVLS